MRKTIFTLALAASMTVVTAVAQPRLDKDNIDEVYDTLVEVALTED